MAKPSGHTVFVKDLKGLQKDFPGFIEACALELANRLLAKVTLRTPVDSGKLRRSWTFGEVKMTSYGAEIEVFNPVYYSPYVEYGHRTPNGQGWVEGRFMMTISVQELERELPKIMDKRLEQFMKKKMGR